MKPQTILDSHLHPTVFNDGLNKKVIDAMKQFGKQEVVNFTDWTLSGECEYSLTNNNEWTNDTDNSVITTEELYNIYLNIN